MCQGWRTWPYRYAIHLSEHERPALNIFCCGHIVSPMDFVLWLKIRMSLDRPTLTYVVISLSPGGTEKLVIEMSLAFAAEYDVTIVCLDEPGLWASDLRARGIPVFCLWRQPGIDLRLPVRLAHYFRQSNTQIIHAHQCTPWFYSALSRLFYPASRLLFEEHGRFFPEVTNLKRIIVNRLLIKRLTNAFIAVSKDVRERLIQYEGLDARSIELIYNGVRVEPALAPATRDELRSKLGFKPSHFVVGTVGRFDPIKNFPMLIDSLAHVSKVNDEVRGLLVGEGPELVNVKSLVVENGLCDRVHLTGYRSDAKLLIQCMDLFVLPSFSEGTSMALLEAIASRVPVIVTGVGGNPEVVKDGETGWIVPSNSVDGLVAALLDSINNPQKRRQFAMAAENQFEFRFAFDRMIESYRQQYRRLLASTI